LRRAVKSLAALSIVAAFWCGGAPECKAQPIGGIIGFSATNYNVLESAGSVTIPLWRTNGDANFATMQINSLNGTAINGNDFLFTSANAAFPPGVISNGFNISITKHSTLQPTKSFYLYLSSPSGATLDTNVPPLVSSNTVVTIIGSLPTLGVTQNGPEVILNWSGSWVLQTTTNLTGPWTDLPAASSPFTNLIGSQPAAFFRLR